MLPLGHLSFAYLWYVAVAAVTTRRLPATWALVWVGFGSQFPDLVDKPLAYIGVLSYGRSLTHSIFALLVISAAVWWGARWLAPRWPTAWPDTARRTFPLAFSVAYASHLAGDALKPVVAGNYADARFLLYPLYSLPESPADEIAPWVRMVDAYQTMNSHPQSALIVLAVIVFLGVRAWQYLVAREFKLS